MASRASACALAPPVRWRGSRAERGACRAVCAGDQPCLRDPSRVRASLPEVLVHLPRLLDPTRVQASLPGVLVDLPCPGDPSRAQASLPGLLVRLPRLLVPTRVQASLRAAHVVCAFDVVGCWAGTRGRLPYQRPRESRSHPPQGAHLATWHGSPGRPTPEAWERDLAAAAFVRGR